MTIDAASAALSMSASDDVLLSSTGGALSLTSGAAGVTLQGASGASIVTENKANSGNIVIAPGTGTGAGTGTGGSVSITAGGTALIGGSVIISEGTSSGTDGYITIGSDGGQSRGFATGTIQLELSATPLAVQSCTTYTIDIATKMKWAGNPADVVIMTPLATDSRLLTLRVTATGTTTTLDIHACNHHPSNAITFASTDAYSLFVVLSPVTPT